MPVFNTKNIKLPDPIFKSLTSQQKAAVQLWLASMKYNNPKGDKQYEKLLNLSNEEINKHQQHKKRCHKSGMNKVLSLNNHGEQPSLPEPAVHFQMLSDEGEVCSRDNEYVPKVQTNKVICLAEKLTKHQSFRHVMIVDTGTEWMIISGP